MQYPVKVPYPPVLFVGSTGTYAVGGMWVRIPDGTKREDIYQYAVCDREVVTFAPKFQKYQVMGSKGDTYEVVNSSDSWSCTCHGFAFNKRCKHITSLKSGNANPEPKKATKFCANPVQLSNVNGTINSRGNKNNQPASIKEKEEKKMNTVDINDVNVENAVNTNNEENAVDNSAPITETLPVVENDVKKFVRPVVTDINKETLAVTLTLGDGRAVQAEPFRWGRKMLMKVSDTTLERGERVSIGQIAKKALTAAGLVLPVAELKRPRKPKVEAVTEIPALEASASTENIDVNSTPTDLDLTPPTEASSADDLNDQLDSLLATTEV